MQNQDIQTVLALQFGGLGDLVLVSELIGSLKSAHPEWKVILACMNELVSLAGLFPIAPDEVIGLDLNPYLIDHPSEELRHSLNTIERRFVGFRTGILIDCSLRPTWLASFLNSLLEPGRSFCCAGAHEPAAMLAEILSWFGLSKREMIDLGPPPEFLERERYRLLLDELDVPIAHIFPWPQPTGEAQANDWLEANGLPKSGFVVCFPGGAAATSQKRWPKENFVRTIDFIRSQGFPVLLLGGRDEQEQLRRISYVLRQGPAPVFGGDSATLQLAACILSKAAGYLGNDTGPMHLAQAYDIPGVAVFGGGGQWPRYAPWAAGSVGLVHPLPCFGCNWDCFLGRALCVESITVEAVTEAMFDALENRTGARPKEPGIISLQSLDSALLPLISDASARYRSVQADRARRMEAILGLTHANERLTTERESRIILLDKAAEEHLALHQAELDRLALESSDRERRITEIQAAADERLVALEEVTGALRERDGRITGLEQKVAARILDREEALSRLKAAEAVADERLAVLQRVHVEAAERLAIMEEMAAAIQERDRRIAGCAQRMDEEADSGSGR